MGFCQVQLLIVYALHILSLLLYVDCQFRISTDDTKGAIKAYLGTGEITDDPYGMDGCIAVTKVNNLQTLMKYICKNGFEHHVAMVRNDVKEILNEAIEDYLGWNLYVHE